MSSPVMSPPPMAPPPRRPRSFAGPFVLIIIGFVFLLSTMHVLSVGRLERYKGQTCYSSRFSVKYQDPQDLVSAGIMQAIPWNEMKAIDMLERA